VGDGGTAVWVSVAGGSAVPPGDVGDSGAGVPLPGPQAVNAKIIKTGKARIKRAIFPAIHHLANRCANIQQIIIWKTILNSPFPATLRCSIR
jgi:hypothetical protein